MFICPNYKFINFQLYQKLTMTQKLGSGHKYFDINDKLNNKELWGLDIQNMNHEDMMSKSIFVLGQMFSTISQDAPEKVSAFLEQILSSKSPEVKRFALTQRALEHHQLHYYKNNRDNILITAAALGFRKFKSGEAEQLKRLVLACIEIGINPQEKSAREGETALALLFRNTEADIDMFTFFASLSPVSLLDLNEEGTPAMALLATANRGEKFFVWLANALPLHALQSNMDSVKKKVKSSSRVRAAYELMEHRLIHEERNALDKAVTLASSPSAPTLKV